MIPPLQAGDRLEDWKLLFQAAATPLLAKDGGETSHTIAARVHQ